VKARRKGGGRRPLEVIHPEIVPALEKLVDPVTRGDPGVAAALDVQEHAPFVRGAVHAAQAARRRDGAVGRLLKERGYSLQGASKTVEGAQHPDRNAQFEHINAKAQDCIERGVPFISVDTKKKELVGNFRNAGQEWQREGEPELVDVHDFPNDAVGKAIPYGVYDVAANDGLRERRR